MAEQFHEGRAVLIERISTQLNMFLSSIETAIRNNLPNRNVLAETTLIGLLNLIHDWDLVNANSIRQNFPGIDLIDPDRKIGIQVTSTNTLKKLDNTLEKVANLPDDVQIDHLHIMVITSDPPSPTMKGRAQAPYFSGSDDIWNIATLLRQIMDLPVSKLERICAYLDAELGTLREKMAQKCLNLPLSSALDKDSFVGRENELEEIARKLHSGAKPIVLSGLGGMGKTELAVRFGTEYKDGKVYFVRFSESFTATVTAMFRGVFPQPQDPPSEAEQYETVMSLLKACSEKDILIIDNVDADSGTLRDLMKDKTYKQLKDMKLRLILTTRFDEDRSVGIHPMPNKILYEIFENHGASLEESQMDDLIDAVNGHTLTIDLMARTLNGKGWRKVTAEMLLDAIRENTLPGANYKKIASDYSQSEGQAQIYQHLKVVFDAAGISPEGKNVLRCATLLPESGMNGEYFHEALSEREQNEFEALIDHGWLNAEDGVLTIHPVIRLVCREELEPTDENCGDFLNALWGQLDYREYDQVKYGQLAEVFTQAPEHLEDRDAKWINLGGSLLIDLAQYEAARTLYEKHLLKLEEQLKGADELATVYNNLGYAYGELGDHRQALEFQLKALTILENVLPENPKNLAASYGNVGMTYGNLGDYQKASEFQLKALEFHKKVLPENHPDLALSYNNVGTIYCELGDHQKALEFLRKALEIRKNVLPENHPDLALSYNNVGVTYGMMGDHQKALVFQMKAMEINEKVLPENHPDLATSYCTVGYTYNYLGDPQEALEFTLKALEIRKKVLPENHPDLALSYNNVGGTYDELGEHHKALEFLWKALEIREMVLPENHPDLAQSYNNIGMTYVKMGDFPRALGYLEQALAIWESVLPPEHPYIEAARQNIDYVYVRFMAMLQQAGISLDDLMKGEA